MWSAQARFRYLNHNAKGRKRELHPPFNSNRHYEVFWGETMEKRAFEGNNTLMTWSIERVN